MDVLASDFIFFFSRKRRVQELTLPNSFVRFMFMDLWTWVSLIKPWKYISFCVFKKKKALVTYRQACNLYWMYADRLLTHTRAWFSCCGFQESGLAWLCLDFLLLLFPSRKNTTALFTLPCSSHAIIRARMGALWERLQVTLVTWCPWWLCWGEIMCAMTSQQLQDVHVSDLLLWSPNKETC